MMSILKMKKKLALQLLTHLMINQFGGLRKRRMRKRRHQVGLHSILKLLYQRLLHKIKKPRQPQVEVYYTSKWSTARGR